MKVRHPVKMTEPTPPAGAPEQILQLIMGMLMLGVVSGVPSDQVVVLDEPRIRERSKPIMYAIARARRYPHEKRFVYRPLAGQEDEYRWMPQTRAELKDYNLRDLAI